MKNLLKKEHMSTNQVLELAKKKGNKYKGKLHHFTCSKELERLAAADEIVKLKLGKITYWRRKDD